jgi:hypothetical protein
VRLLVLNHYFDQDIESLRDAAGSHAELRVLSYAPIRAAALEIFPHEVATGLEAFARVDYAPYRRGFAIRLREILEELFNEWEFDAFVAPSDVFFYVRAAPEACHSLGVPFFVAQKETTISDYTMRVHAETVRRYSPPIADHMTVCSERHRAFWLRAGADPSRVTVTGQPRFDFYVQPSRWPESLPYGDHGPVVLFFSYQFDSYHPSEGAGEPVWARLHRETEQALWELAARGWRVLIKPHPQQDFSGERARIANEVGSLVGRRIFLVPPGADTRRLIVGSDVVVGFQTTALLESMLAGKPVVYTGWDQEAHRLSPDLIPFHEWIGEVDFVERKDQLVATVEAALEHGSTGAGEARRAIVEEFLGPVDGHASKRTLDLVRSSVESFESSWNDSVRGHRARVAARRPSLRRRARRVFGRARASVGPALNARLKRT